MVQVHEGEEQVREVAVVLLQPVEPNERLVHIAHLVCPGRVPRGDAWVVMRGRLHEGAQGVPQVVADGLVRNGSGRYKSPP